MITIFLIKQKALLDIIVHDFIVYVVVELRAFYRKIYSNSKIYTYIIVMHLIETLHFFGKKV